MEQSRQNNVGPIAAKNSSLVSTNEVAKFISELGISKVALKTEDIESILSTIVFDGKAEKCETDGVILYRAIEPIFPSAGLARCPCGVCPVIRKCGTKGNIRPETCKYFRDWLEEF